MSIASAHGRGAASVPTPAAAAAGGGRATRFRSLDALRGVAALAVVFWHWRHFWFVGGALSASFVPSEQPLFGCVRLFYLYGFLAVELFFSLSGFIFFWLYSGVIADRSMRTSRFFVLRFSRLYPLHFATLLAVAFGQIVYRRMFGADFVYRNDDAYHFLLNLLLLPSVGLERGSSFNGPVWSIGVEAILYAVFFALCRHRLRGPLTAASMGALGFLVLRPIYAPIGLGVGCFFLGGLAYHAYAGIERSGRRRRWTAAIAAAAALMWSAVVLAVYSGQSPMQWLPAGHPHLAHAFGHFPYVMLFPLTILWLALVEVPGPLGRAGGHLGDISYSVYLLHFPLQLASALVAGVLGLGAAAFVSPAALILFFALLLPLAHASYRHLERPAMARLRGR